MPQIKSNGISIHYEEQGSGDPLLLIMGFTVSSDRLALEHPCLCSTLPHHCFRQPWGWTERQT